MLPSVVLGADEREWLTRVVRTGAHPAQEVRRSRILLELDDSRRRPAGRREIAQRVGVDPDTITNVARAYAERGGDVAATIQRRKRLTPPVEPKITGEVEARLIALACSTRRRVMPAGRCGCSSATSRWSRTSRPWTTRPSG